MTFQTSFFSLLVKEKMNKILYIILSLLLFSLTMISCSPDDNETINEPVRKGGDAVNDVLDPVGDGINDGLDPVGDTVNDGLDTVGDTVNDGVGTITGGTGGGSSTTTDSTTNLTWTKQLGSSGHEFGLGVTTDSSDNIYVTGLTYEDVVCPILLLQGEECIYTNRDIILIKYNSSGTKQWTKHYGEDGKGVTTDSSGNIYVTSYTDSDKSDIILIKYNSSGTKQWTKQLGASSRTFGDSGFGVTPDSSGNIYLSGHTWRSNLDGKIDNSPRYRSETDLFLIKYNSSGKRQWTKQLKTPASDRCGAVTTDSSGNIYMTGHTLGGLAGWTKPLIGQSDLFLIKFNSSGKRQWIKQLGTSDIGPDGRTVNTWGRGVTTDSSDNIYVSGLTWGGFGGKKHEGKSDIILIKFNSSGTKKWIRQFGTSGLDWGTDNCIQAGKGVTTDSSDNIYLTGRTPGGLDGNKSSGGKDIFLVKYNSIGTKQWTKQLGTSDNDSGESVTTDSSGNIYVTGTTQGGLDGNTNSGKDDIFLVKYDSSGTKQ